RAARSVPTCRRTPSRQAPRHAGRTAGPPDLTWRRLPDRAGRRLTGLARVVVLVDAVPCVRAGRRVRTAARYWRLAVVGATAAPGARCPDDHPQDEAEQTDAHQDVTDDLQVEALCDGDPDAKPEDHPHSAHRPPSPTPPS